ncbi:uncharacterized protein BDCG_03434 [Blastomyces dermatitidis ER-3]|uniref:DUF7730 domain-containing protein n=1 Tax=Ajellomyces dermatitidis (strain ER-3 / ATCC MYA-2586) TaxID=559297 RepID=A0ABP2EW94_AJEDR|nr:uncharacterized protein BDCG_03434 [Blastomyces dermatitidis ER-3]EEQ88314.1 hypothetical protein BDCG_03434 [Blastomyces dermatitidis ER-3]
MRAPVDPFSCCGEVSEVDSDSRRTEWICCALCFWILCPIISCMYGYSACRTCYVRHAEAKHHSQLIIEASIPPLPKRRPRNLSLSASRSRPSPHNPLVPIPPMLYGSKSQEGTLHDQASSPLFKLSAELRQMIYRKVLSWHQFAIMRIRSYSVAKQGGAKGKAKPSRLSHLKYSAESERGRKFLQNPPWLRRYFGIVGIRPSPLNRDFEPNVPGEELLPLVKSCRRIYLEAIDLLYSSNTFHFYHEDDFLAFSRSILPQRMEKITSVHLHYFPDYYSIASNPQLVRVIPTMRDLQLLDISFTATSARRQRSAWFDDDDDVTKKESEGLVARKLRDFGENVLINLRVEPPSDGDQLSGR